jgi:predicted histidine transporter YuiF (NhaC family)
MWSDRGLYAYPRWILGDFLDNILLHYLKVNGMQVTLGEIISALKFPAIGMICGVVLAIFRYQHPRKYELISDAPTAFKNKPHLARYAIISVIAILAALVIQLVTGKIILGALAGFSFFRAAALFVAASRIALLLMDLR